MKNSLGYISFLVFLVLASVTASFAADDCQPIAASGGAIGWDVLGQTKGKDQQIDGAWQVVPEFAKGVKALAGQTIKVRGYMLPLQSREGRSQFVLMATSPDCATSSKAGAQLWMQIKASTPVQYRREPMVLEGQLELVKSDPDGTFYRLNSARLVN